MTDEDDRRRLRDAAYIPDHRVVVVRTPKRVRVVLGGEVIADSRAVLLVRESGETPVYYLPRRDCRPDTLSPAPRRTRCPHKGGARYWHVSAGGRLAEEAAWEYDAPTPQGPDLRGYVSFAWRGVDAWFEEDEEVFVHPRDPFKRVDVLNGSCHVQVVIHDEIVADTRRPVLLFETGLPTRYYLPKMDVSLARLEPSVSVTRCPYKGEAGYYSVRGACGLVEDVVWYYRYPLPEVGKIAGLLCFYNERVDALYVDGEREEAPPTPWSVR